MPRIAVAFSAAVFLLVLSLSSLGATPARALTHYDTGSFGYDVSYPQCGAELPATPGFAIVGVTGGKSFTKNACFAEQMTWARTGGYDAAVYVNTNGAPKSYRGSGCGRRDAKCHNYQYGLAAAQYALDYANTAAADVTRYWLDVETMNSWSRDKAANAEVLRAWIDVLRANGKIVGIYSTSYQYGRIARSFSPGLDNWVPRPEATRETAASFCHTTPSFGAGSVVMLQLWYEFDENYVC